VTQVLYNLALSLPRGEESLEMVQARAPPSPPPSLLFSLPFTLV
jgi:hypothetical protein